MLDGQPRISPKFSPFVLCEKMDVAFGVRAFSFPIHPKISRVAFGEWRQSRILRIKIPGRGCDESAGFGDADEFLHGCLSFDSRRNMVKYGEADGDVGEIIGQGEVGQRAVQNF